VKGEDRSLPSDFQKKQFLCQIVIAAKFNIESDRYSEELKIAEQSKCEKKS
jgi:hypothetical protein